ncbi:MAG: hypothetical protein E7253_00930 [Lachnospiraceae bacterium]|nr:hypothetical protein [Lachnospiraceae bacterium]
MKKNEYYLADIAEYEKYISSIADYDPLDKDTLQHYGKIILNSRIKKTENNKTVTRVNLDNPQAKHAVDMLTKHHLKYVVSRIHALKNSNYENISMMDFVQEGNDGLLEAIHNWDYRKGALTTYSKAYIDGRILKLFPVAAPLPDSAEEKQILNSLSDDEARKRKKRVFEKEHFRRATEEYALSLDAPIDSEDQDNEDTYESIIPDETQVTDALDSDSDSHIYQKLWSIKLSDPLLQSVLKEYLLDTKESIIAKKYHLSSMELSACKERIQKCLFIELPKVNLRELTKEEIHSIYAILHQIPSGETTYLVNKQKNYSQLFQFSEEPHMTKTLPMWTFDEETFAGSRQKEILYEEFQHIRSVPCYKYMIRYLLNEYYLHIGPENEKKLWNYLESNWRLKKRNAFDLSGTHDFSKLDFSESHCAALLSLLYKYVSEEYAAYDKTLSTTEFKKLIYFESSNAGEMLNEFALIFHLDEETYSIFREKVAKMRNKDFLDRDFVFTLLVIKYADQCNISDWISAFYTLKKLYPVNDTMTYEEYSSDVTNTIALGNEIVLNLEQGGFLKAEYKESLFLKPIDKLEDFFRQEMVLKSANPRRTFDEELKRQWKELEFLLPQEESFVLFLAEQESWKKHRDAKTSVDFHTFQRFLYGNETLARKLNPSKLKSTYRTHPGSFLDTEEFENTFIDDNILMQFGNVGNIRRRNILMTMLFLNFSYNLSSTRLQALSYPQRVAFFQNKIVEPFTRCGFLPFHPSVGYDAFLKLLLTCSNPLDLFRFIWKDKLAGGTPHSLFHYLLGKKSKGEVHHE